jgi:hypothetical protein
VSKPRNEAFDGQVAGYVELWIDVQLEESNQLLLYTKDELAAIMPPVQLASSGSIGLAQVQSRPVNVESTNANAKLTRLCGRAALDKKHDPALRAIANIFIPHVIAHRQMNKIFHEVIADPAPTIVSSFIEFPVAAGQSAEHLTDHLNYLWTAPAVPRTMRWSPGYRSSARVLIGMHPEGAIYAK